MTDDVERPQTTDRIWEPVEAEGVVETDDQEEPALHAGSALDAVPALKSNIRPSDPAEQKSDAPPPSTSREPRGRLTRAAPLFFFFVFSMSIVFLIGMFIGASRVANLPTRSPPAEVSVPVPLSPSVETPAPDSSTTGYSSPEPAPSQSGSANTTTTKAAPAPSTSATASSEEAPAAPEPMPASAQPTVAVDAPPLPTEPAPAPPIPTETVASTPSPIAPAQAPATIPTETVASTPSPIAPAQAPATMPTVPDHSNIQRQALLARGDAFFSAGDVTSARLFYQRGADAGDGTAALRLAETFDAAFLERAHLGRVPSDPEKAVSWYRRARDLGNAEAEILLEELLRQLMK